MAAQLASRPSFWPRLKQRIEQERIGFLEKNIDRISEMFGQPDFFVMPGASLKSAYLHQARSVCRRCERVVITVAGQGEEYNLIIAYLNRLSDLLFMLAWAQEVKDVVIRVINETGCAAGPEGDSR